MEIEELHEWILASDRLRDELNWISRQIIRKDYPFLEDAASARSEHEIDWRRLLLSASVLSFSNRPDAREAALRLATGALHLSESQVHHDGALVVLEQLQNQVASRLAVDKHLAEPDLASRLGFSSSMGSFRRRADHTIHLSNGDEISASRFQLAAWSKASSSRQVSITGPTASGKSFVVLRWMIEQCSIDQLKLAIYLAPTRALVSEIEERLQDLARSNGVELRVTSLPLPRIVEPDKPTIFVLTQERCHLLLNSIDDTFEPDLLVVDEAHKIGEPLRGVILEIAIERVCRLNPDLKTVYLSPSVENPEDLLTESSDASGSATVPTDEMTVLQNLIYANHVPRNTKLWRLDLVRPSGVVDIGRIELANRPTPDSKRISFLAVALGRNQVGTLVYANRPYDAEKIARQIYDALGAGIEVDLTELADLAELARHAVHERFQLAELLRRGVAFHYGNMPSIVRSSIEELFRVGVIKFLVCTSTLIEGVNISCRTILLRNPKKGGGNPMQPHDFWNLAGRAGRWGREFQGNIICVDTNKAWENPPPIRAKYHITRATQASINDHRTLIDFMKGRNEHNFTGSEIELRFEYMLAYLIEAYRRSGTLEAAGITARLSTEQLEEHEEVLDQLCVNLDIPNEIARRHPGISAIAMQKLLDFFRTFEGDAELLVPPPPESDDAVDSFSEIFEIINKTLYPAFGRGAAPLMFAIVTVHWMEGWPLRKIIDARLNYDRRQGKTPDVHQVIRATMDHVEQYARFRAPRYLSCYTDILRIYLSEAGREDVVDELFEFELALEFGVPTKTLLSLIALGLSRTSALLVGELISEDALEERECVEWLTQQELGSLDLPVLVRREIEKILRLNVIAQ